MKGKKIFFLKKKELKRKLVPTKNMIKQSTVETPETPETPEKDAAPNKTPLKCIAETWRFDFSDSTDYEIETLNGFRYVFLIIDFLASLRAKFH